ncbi:MAG: hypothetical protein Q4D58_08350 [Synergistaceae bacterium]|nr:hypothetical protein [Synergistaceae bacterium]
MWDYLACITGGLLATAIFFGVVLVVTYRERRREREKRIRQALYVEEQRNKRRTQ